MPIRILNNLQNFNELTFDHKFLVDLIVYQGVLPHDILCVNLFQNDYRFRQIMSNDNLNDIVTSFDHVPDGQVDEVVLVRDEPLSRGVFHLSHFFYVNEPPIRLSIYWLLLSFLQLSRKHRIKILREPICDDCLLPLYHLFAFNVFLKLIFETFLHDFFDDVCVNFYDLVMHEHARF